MQGIASAAGSTSLSFAIGESVMLGGWVGDQRQAFNIAITARCECKAIWSTPTLRASRTGESAIEFSGSRDYAKATAIHAASTLTSDSVRMLTMTHGNRASCDRCGKRQNYSGVWSSALSDTTSDRDAGNAHSNGHD